MLTKIFLLGSLSLNSFAANYDFLKPLEHKRLPHVLEKPLFETPPSPPANADLSSFYKEFEKDGVVTIYQAIANHHAPYLWGQTLKGMLEAIRQELSLPLGQFVLNASKTELSFVNESTGIRYVVRMGSDRYEFKEAFGNSEIVSYVGHSRYGHGPAFKTMHDYYRMGSIFATTEIDVLNPHFMKEQILLTETYPLQNVVLEGKDYQY